MAVREQRAARTPVADLKEERDETRNQPRGDTLFTGACRRSPEPWIFSSGLSSLGWQAGDSTGFLVDADPAGVAVSHQEVCSSAWHGRLRSTGQIAPQRGLKEKVRVFAVVTRDSGTSFVEGG